MIKIDLPNIDEIRLTMRELKLKRIGGTTDIMGLEGKRVYFLFRDFNHLPESEGVYFIFSSNEELIYVGVSNNIQKRFQHHSSQTVWFTKEASYVAYVLAKDFNIKPDNAERIYISLYEPLYNDKTDNTVLKGGISLVEIHENGKYPQIRTLVR